MTEGERQAACEQARAVYEEAGADYVLHDYTGYIKNSGIRERQRLNDGYGVV